MRARRRLRPRGHQLGFMVSRSQEGSEALLCTRQGWMRKKARWHRSTRGRSIRLRGLTDWLHPSLASSSVPPCLIPHPGLLPPACRRLKPRCIPAASHAQQPPAPARARPVDAMPASRGSGYILPSRTGTCRVARVNQVRAATNASRPLNGYRTFTNPHVQDLSCPPQELASPDIPREQYALLEHARIGTDTFPATIVSMKMASV